MYVHAKYNIEEDHIDVIERVDGKRVFKEFKPDHSFYVTDNKGTDMSIYGDAITKLMPNNKKDKSRLLKINQHKKLFESDIQPVARCIEQEYQGSDTATLQTAFFDIETDFDQVLGYSSPEEAFNKITSIATYLQWMDVMICLAVPPKTLTWDEASLIAKDVPNVILCKTEKEMLTIFLELIQDADVLSGWNSEFYDIPYTINRVTTQLGKQETRKMCLWDSLPKKKYIDRNEQKIQTYELVGRVHLDYLSLYKKYTYEERQSYKLDTIAEYELGDKKVAYEGTLDQLYNNDFKKFLEYNIQDTMLLHRLDIKLQFIDLANTIAHGACVLIPATMGAVAVTEQAIIVEAHRRGMKVMDKKHGDKGDTRAAGGWVQHPKKGLQKDVGSSDLNSLYPSVLRALNMSPETIVGQLRTDKTMATIDTYIEAAKRHSFGEWWNDRFNTLEMDDFNNRDIANKYIFEMEDGSKATVTGAELNKIVFESGEPWCISANGTVFRTDIDGIIPGLLSGWYSDRKLMKKILWDMVQLRTGMIKTTLKDIPVLESYPNLKRLQYGEISEFADLIKNNDNDGLLAFATKYGLSVKDGAFCVSEAFLARWREAEGYWDKRQLVRKINLNSLYGGLLNEHCRFFDQRLGQSTTLTGRSITRHMAAKTNEIIAGEYDENGVSIMYGDTDSCGGSTIIESSLGAMSIEDLYNTCQSNTIVGDKEYAHNNELMVMSYDKDRDEPYMGHINYIYRHKVSKDLYEIEDSEGNKVTVTEDHSVMIEQNGVLIEVKPMDINEGDIVVCIHH